jgi:hypothetical protein
MVGFYRFRGLWQPLYRYNGSLQPEVVFHGGEGHTARLIELVKIEPLIEFANRMGYGDRSLKAAVGVQNATDGIRKGLEVLFRHFLSFVSFQYGMDSTGSGESGNRCKVATSAPSSSCSLSHEFWIIQKAMDVLVHLGRGYTVSICNCTESASVPAPLTATAKHLSHHSTSLFPNQILITSHFNLLYQGRQIKASINRTTTAKVYTTPMK